MNLLSTPLYGFRLMKTFDSRFLKRDTSPHGSKSKPLQNLQERKTTHKTATVYEIMKKKYYIVKSDTSFWNFNSYILLRWSICRPWMTQQMSCHSSYNSLSSWDQSVFGMAHVDGASIQGCFFCFQMPHLLSVPTFLNLFFNVATVTGCIISTLIAVNKPSIFLPNKTVQKDYLGENLICQKCMCETVQRLGRIYSPESQFPYSPSEFTTNSYHHWNQLYLQI